MGEFVRDHDRSNEKRLIDDYDVERGYARAHDEARAAFARLDECAPCPLIERGFQKFENVLGRERCRELIAATDDGLDDWISNTNKRNTVAVIEEILTPDIDRAIISHFESEYVPTVVNFTRTESRDDGYSSRWHCDGGPSKLLVMIVYLTDSEADGSGTTMFVKRAASQTLFEHGYVFTELGNRLDNDGMAALADELGFDFEPVNLGTRAGDAALFDARHIMHRGYYPTVGARYDISVAFIPFKEDWRSGCAATFFPRMGGPFESYPPVTW